MTDSIDGTTILQLNKNILKRYEHKFQEGTMILYDVDREKVWFGNSSTRDLINLIDGKTNLNDIYTKLLYLFDGSEITDIIESFNLTIDDLYDKKFIEIVKNKAMQ